MSWDGIDQKESIREGKETKKVRKRRREGEKVEVTCMDMTKKKKK